MNEKKNTIKADSVLEERARMDNHWKDFYKNIEEPDLRNNKTEAYRFTYNIQYDDYLILTLIAIDKVDSLDLGERLPRQANLFCKIVNDGKKDTVFKSSKQLLTEQEFAEFNYLLRGSYYWKLIDEPCIDGMIRDGRTVGFESMSYACSHDGLVYRSFYLGPLYEGSFKEAFSFLLTRAQPFKGDRAAQRYILRN